MKSTRESLAGEKRDLVARCELCRLHLRREVRCLRDTLRWKATLSAVAPSTRRIAFGVALSWFGLARAVRMVAFAGRVVLGAKLAGSLIAYAMRSPVDGRRST